MVVLSLVREVAGAADAIHRELLRSHPLVDFRADVGGHTEALHGVRIEAVLDFRPRDAEAVRVSGLAVRVEIELHAVLRERRLIEHAADAELAREDVIEFLHELQAAETHVVVIDRRVVRPLDEIHGGGVGIALREVPPLVADLHAERRAVFAKLAVAQRLDASLEHGEGGVRLERLGRRCLGHRAPLGCLNCTGMRPMP